MIYVLLGSTCSGKTTVLKQLTKLGYESIVSYTTRPIRPNEIGGKDYHFVTDEQYQELDKNNQLVLKNSFKNAYGTLWHYGINRDSIDLEKTLFVITEPKGYRELISILGEKHVTGIYLKASYETLVQRGLKRLDNKQELIRRIKSDEVDFKDFEKEVKYCLTSDDDVLEDILRIVEGHHK